jgi:hypothetical protein
VTIHLEFPWEKKRREREEAAMEAKRKAYTDQMNAVCAEPTQPRRPPHPCEHQGHDYQPLDKSRKFILLCCVRCAKVERIPIHQPQAEVPRPRRCADLA